MLYPITDQYIGQSLDRYGEFSEGEAELFRQIVRPGRFILDIGAHIGVHTIFLAKTTGPQGRVYAFEPQRILFQILCANVALNALGNVYTQQVALGRAAGSITVPHVNYATTGNFGGLSLGSWSKGEPVPMSTVDALNLPACHLIKLDVEGMEREVLAGAEQTLQRFRPVLYVENDREANSAALIQQLMDWDYRLYWHLPPMFSPANFFGESQNVFPNIVSVNMLGLHKSVNQNIQGLREIRSPQESWRG
jgi:FkbM family methyltransferase